MGTVAEDDVERVSADGGGVNGALHRVVGQRSPPSQHGVGGLVGTRCRLGRRVACEGERATRLGRVVSVGLLEYPDDVAATGCVELRGRGLGACRRCGGEQ